MNETASKIDRRYADYLGVYVASKTRHADLWKRYREQGLPVASTWIDEAGALESTKESWVRFVAECRCAAALILYAEEGDRLEGALVEVGIALAASVPVLTVGPVSRSRFPFTQHPLVKTCSSLDEAVKLATALAEEVFTDEALRRVRARWASSCDREVDDPERRRSP